MRTKSLAVVLYETRKIAIGELITVGLIVLFYALLNKFHYTVVTGSLLGAFVAVSNIFFMGLSVIRSLEKSTEAEAKKITFLSYLLRMGFMALALVLAFKSPFFDGISAAIPLLVPRLIIFVASFFENKDFGNIDQQNGSEKE
jgi:hypothetical protein